MSAETGRKWFLKILYKCTAGCQMNVNDSEVVRTVLDMAGGYSFAPSAEEADVVLLNTCAIRENAESKIWQRLGYFKNMKMERRKRYRFEEGTGKRGPVVGVLGCMAERLKHKLLERDRLVDLVVGPDAYRDLPNLIETISPREIKNGENAATAINVQLSVEETYADIIPMRHSSEHSVFLSIMRGCNNMCSFCVVPYTRGRERSRPVSSIIDEIQYLSDTGEIHLVAPSQVNRAFLFY
jgi:tRNA A37 methylthiotransferase MiaB